MKKVKFDVSSHSKRQRKHGSRSKLSTERVRADSDTYTKRGYYKGKKWFPEVKP